MCTTVHCHKQEKRQVSLWYQYRLSGVVRKDSVRSYEASLLASYNANEAED